MITKNLTPFHWGTKVTAREPRRLEMTCVVRATFRLAPGAPLTPIEDPIEQGFLTGDVLPDDDVERTGAVRYASDLVDWKPRADVLLHGTCYAPGGKPTTHCPVRFEVGGWAKELAVIGPRVWLPGLLFGHSAGEAAPFTRMPLVWENAYGGPGYAANPVGRGYVGDELPTVELPGRLVGRRKDRPPPAGFGPINPLWEPRAAKRGRKYDAEWRRTRAPFYSEDFDWTFWNAAPADQQLEAYLRGDERLAFHHLHPREPLWDVPLPGLRIRVLVEDDRGDVREVPMHLDTLCADVDGGRLYLTWRGLTPVRALDLTDVTAALVASEALDREPAPAEVYREQLAAFVADPVGLDGAFPPGFLEMAKELEEADRAQLESDDPPPPPGPKQVPPAVQKGLGLALPAVPDPSAVPARPADAPEDAAADAVVALFAPGLALLGAKGAELAGQIRQGVAAAREQLKPEDFQRLMAAAKAPPPLPRLPTPPVPAPVQQQLQALAADLTRRKQGYLDRGIDHPLLGLFDRGQALIGRALAPPKPAPPFLPGLGDKLAEARAALAQSDLPAERKGELEPRFQELEDAVDQLQAAFPAPVLGPGPGGEDLVGQDLSRQDLTDRDLTRADLARADLSGATLRGVSLRGARLAGADLRGACLAEADLTGADLSGADLGQADLQGATLGEADLRGAGLAEADLTGARLGGARLEDADAPGARFVEADLREARLDGANLERASFERAQLSGARLESARLVEARLAEAELSGADLRFALLTKADLRRALLRQADLSLANLEQAKADEADLTGARLDMTQLGQARLRRANLREVQGQMTQAKGADLRGASLVEARLDMVELAEADLEGADLSRAHAARCSFRGVRAAGATFRRADLREAVLSTNAVFRGADLRQVQAQRSIWQGSDLSQADLSFAELQESHLQGARGTETRFFAADLRGAGLSKASFERADFQQANLCGVDLTHSRLDGGAFENANCYDMKLLGAHVTGCEFRGANLTALQLDPEEAA